MENNRIASERLLIRPKRATISSHDPRQSRGLEEALEGHDTDNAPKGASNGSANCIADSWRAPEGAFFYALVFLLPVNGSMNSFMLI